MTDKEKIRAETERLKKLAKKNCIESGWDGYDAQVWVLDNVLSFIDSLPEETNSVDGVVSHFAGVDQAAIRYTDPSGINMTYYAKRDDFNVGDKVKIVIFKEK